MKRKEQKKGILEKLKKKKEIIRWSVELGRKVKKNRFKELKKEGLV